MTAKFGAVTRWLRSQTDLPIWWAEFYIATTRGADDDHVAAIAMAAILHMLDAGAAATLIWQPEDDPGERFVSLWTSTRKQDGGNPLPLATGAEGLQKVLAAPATDGAVVTWLSPTLALARGQKASLLLNASGEQATARLNGSDVTVKPWEARSLGAVPVGAAALAPTSS
jgi:hypothetical protein